MTTAAHFLASSPADALPLALGTASLTVAVVLGGAESREITDFPRLQTFHIVEMESLLLSYEVRPPPSPNLRLLGPP